MIINHCPKHTVLTQAKQPLHPQLTVFIAAYNAGSYLRECLNSVMTQEGIALECVVADDGSTDKTASIAYDIATKDDRLTVISLKSNQGKSQAANIASTYARSDWLCIFDADDSMLPNMLAPYFKSVSQKRDAFWGYCQTRLADHELHPVDTIMGRRFDRVALPLINGICGAMSLFRRDIFNVVGGYDVNLRLGEDYDLSLRLAEYGDPAFWPVPGFLYRRHPTSVTTRSDYTNIEIRQSLSKRLNEFSANPVVQQNRRIFRLSLMASDACKKREWAHAIHCIKQVNQYPINSPLLDLMHLQALRGTGLDNMALELALERIRKDANEGNHIVEEMAAILVHALELARTLDMQPVLDALHSLAQQVARGANNEELKKLVVNEPT